MRYLKILIVLAWAGICGPASLCAQSNPPFQNPSLDSNCYFPQIGDLSEMDTIVGSDSNQDLGGGIIKNLGTKPDGSFGNMFIGNITPTAALAQVATGHSFNLHKMIENVQSLIPDGGGRTGQGNGMLSDYGYRLGHFRDSYHLDIFVPYSWRIYWADDNGNYDSANYSTMSFNKRGDFTGNGGLTGGFIGPYVTRLTSDSLDDLVMSWLPEYFDYTKDTIFLALYRGGITLKPIDTIFEDTSSVLYTNYAIYPSRQTLQGDFRGTGREDLIIMGDSGGTGWAGSRMGDMFFYANDPPFSLEKLAQAINYDTIMARWQNPNLLSQAVVSFSVMAMPALPKSSTDKSVDFLPVFSDTAHNTGIYFFRGNPDFGTRRITLDSAAYVIHQPTIFPTIFQGGEWPLHIADAGDMTGTGNHVLYTLAFVADGTGSPEWDAFFVTGKALDDKIDIYNVSNASIVGDTLTANGDSLEDFLLGTDNSIEGPNGLLDKGGLWLYYGSKQIPVRLNPQFADVKSIPQQNGAGITLSPNPAQTWSVATIVWPESEDGEYSIYDMLGRKVEHGPIQLYGGAEQQRIYFRGMPAGVYIYVIEGAHGSASARFVKLGGASSAAGTSQPSIIQQMKDTRDGKTDPAGLTPSPAIN